MNHHQASTDLDAKAKAKTSTRDPLPGRVVTGLLGLNLWLVFLVIPAPPGYARLSLTALLIAAFPLTALAVGLVLRSGALLLGAYPIFLVLAVISRDFLGGGTLVSTGGLVLSAVSLIGYLTIASTALEWERRPSEDPPELKPLAKREVSSVWRRRRRVYAYLLAATVVIPVTLLYALNVRAGVWARMVTSYEERADAMRILINTGLCGVWSVVFFMALRRPLHLHSRGDRPLQREFLSYERGDRTHVWTMVFLSAGALVLLGVFWLLHT